SSDVCSSDLNQLAAGLRRAPGRQVGLFGRRAQRLEFAPALFERLARGLELADRVRVRVDTIAIELGKRGHGACRLTEAPQIRCRDRKSVVPRLAELVDLNEPRAQLGLLPALGGGERFDAC